MAHAGNNIWDDGDEYGASSAQSAKINPEQVNLHVLYVITGVAHADQLRDAIIQLFKLHNIVCNFKISLVTIRNEYYGYAYVYIENSSVFSRLTGVNSDGTRKTEHIPDPDWKMPIVSLKDALQKHHDKWYQKEKNVKLSWADEADKEEEEESIKARYEQQMLEVPINPELIIPSYKYAAEQKKYIRSRQEADAREKGSEIVEEVPEEGHFRVYVAKVPRTKSNIQQYILIVQMSPPTSAQKI